MPVVKPQSHAPVSKPLSAGAVRQLLRAWRGLTLNSGPTVTQHCHHSALHTPQTLPSVPFCGPQSRHTTGCASCCSRQPLTLRKPAGQSSRRGVSLLQEHDQFSSLHPIGQPESRSSLIKMLSAKLRQTFLSSSVINEYFTET